MQASGRRFDPVQLHQKRGKRQVSPVAEAIWWIFDIVVEDMAV